MKQAAQRKTTARAKAESKMFASIEDCAGLARSISGGLTATLTRTLAWIVSAAIVVLAAVDAWLLGTFPLSAELAAYIEKYRK